jgi:hypothetical protein
MHSMWKNGVGNFGTPVGRASGDFYTFLWGGNRENIFGETGQIL